jgi:hypothetical protein
MSPDGKAVDGGRAPNAKVMARTAAMVALWARGRPSNVTRILGGHQNLQALS